MRANTFCSAINSSESVRGEGVRFMTHDFDGLVTLPLDASVWFRGG